MPDGVWTLSIRNIGDEPITPRFDLTYTTTDTTLGLSRAASASRSSISRSNPLVNGVGRTDLTVYSQVTAPDGSSYTRTMTPQVPGIDRRTT